MNRGDAPPCARSDDRRPRVPTVLVFAHGPGPGGVERIALRLAEGWRRDGVPVRLLLGSALPPGGTKLRTLRMTLALVQAIRRDRPDILFCPGNSYTLIACLVKLLLRDRCPVILAKISNDLVRRDLPPPVRAVYAVWLRIQGRLIDRFAALSEPMARETARRMGVPAAHVHVVPNPVLALDDLAAPPRPRPASSGAPPRRFVAVGRLERQKDYPLMLRAFAQGSGPDDRLTIFGAGRARRDLETLCGALGLERQVRFAGYCDDVLAELPHHDVLLLSSRYEGLPGVVVEALASGLNIVATRCCAGMSGLLDDGILGTLVPPGDAPAFARAVRAARLGAPCPAAARARAGHFTIEHAVPAYRALFARMAPRTAATTRPASPRRSFMKALS